MAFFSLHAYDADLFIPAFLGLNQSDTLMNPDVRFASEAKNLETPRGILQPRAADGVLNGEFEDRVETIGRFYRRLYKGSGSKEFLVAASGGQIYYRQVGATTEWDDMDLPAGVDAFISNTWSWVTYELTENNVTVDVLLMSNADDGMIMIVPPDRSANWADKAEYDWDWARGYTWKQFKSARWAIRTVDTNGFKFGVIERYAERIWGGAIAGKPDTLVYSAPYDPTNWQQDNDHPEDGAGEIQQPSWDGSKFTGLKAFGDQLIAFKRNRLWRILGTDPGQYEFREQYGDGTEYGFTIARDIERILMASTEGVSVYDGTSVAPFMRPNVEKLWKTINKDAMEQMCAAVFHNRYYLAFPVGDSEVNNAMLVYNLEEGTILYYDNVYIESFLPMDYELYATSSALPGRVLIINYDSWETEHTDGAATEWISPWMDFGRKNIQKGGFDFYFLPEVKGDPVTLAISMETEKKVKTKLYTVQPLTEEAVEAGKEPRMKRLHFSGTGRKFRFVIRTEEGVTVPWRIVGGLHLIVETDPD